MQRHRHLAKVVRFAGPIAAVAAAPCDDPSLDWL
jgi:hypothetical protein